MPVPLTPYPPSRWMVLNFSASTAAQFPTDGQGGTTTTASSSALFGAQKVIITGIATLATPGVASTLTFVNMGVTDLFPYSISTNAAADRTTPPLWIELKHGFGVRAAVTDATLRVLVSYIHAN